MAFRFLLTRRDGPVEYLTLNRPEVRNALNDEMIAELAAWTDGIAADPAVRIVVIAGAGKSFSAGADVDWMARTIQYTADQNLRDARALSHMFTALNALPVPVIGRVHGAALGGGAGLAACCDVVVAETETIFGFTEVKLGIIPAVISPFALAKIGRSAARELFLTGARFGAARARDIGLVHAVVASSDVEQTIAGYIAEFLDAGPGAVAASKALIAQVWGHSMEAATTMTASAIANRRVSPEGQEGLKAFLEKRKPSWSPRS
jgi:methylglutaconyl-CoA hydratase